VRTGIAKELEQGKAEATIQMIRNMLCAGLQINQITQIDQLSEEKVKKILEFFAS
jgi:predicted transposase/invertase (TIGR01784 family)